MRAHGSPPAADVVLRLRGVEKVLRAGVVGCRASTRVIAGVDLCVRRGERVAIVDAPADAGTMLLLVAAGLLRPDAGEAWCAPGARLERRVVARHASAAHPLVRGVAERAVVGIDTLRWGADVGGARLALGDAGLDGGRGDVRRLRFRRGALYPADGPRRVDSPHGAL